MDNTNPYTAMYRIEDLQRLKPLISVAGIARLLGMKTDTLHKRLERGSPELTAEQQETLRKTFTEARP